MAVFTIQAPDGRKIKIQAADEATAIRGAQEWAAANPSAGSVASANASAASKRLQGTVDSLPSQRPTMMDEVQSFGRGMIEGVPVAGPMLADWRRGLDSNIASLATGQDAGTLKAGYEAADQELAAKTGGARTAGNITGAVASLAPLGATALGGRLLGTTGTLGQRLAMGAGSGAVISGADTAARGGDLGDVATSAALGGVLGTVFPAVGAAKNAVLGRGAQRAATNAAIKNAPSASDLKAAASQMFLSVDNSGVTIDTNKFGQFVSDLATKAKKMRINPNLDPKATGAYEELIGALGDVQRSGNALTMSDMHTLRQIAQKAAVSVEGRDAMFANMIVDGLDDFITKPGVAVLPPNRLGNGQNAAANELLSAIGTWGRARRVSMIEEAIYKAGNQASGLENGLRTQFRQLLQNPAKRKLFTKAEIQAMEDVVRGNAVSNLAKVAGMFGFNLGGSGSANIVGGSLGILFGGPIGAALGTGARKVSEKLTEGAANRAAKVVATPNVPVLPNRPLPRGMLPPALVPLELTRDRKPLEITVRGGN